MNASLLKLELARTAHLLHALHGVPQDRVWHAEGDVAIHTQMVRDALEQIDEFKALSERDQNVLRLGAALHDVGKVSTTREENGRIIAPHHSPRGMEMVQHLWWREGYHMSPEDRRTVLALIRYHGRPLHGQERLYAHVAAASVVVPIKLVALIAEADVRGRICPDADELLLKIELFREAGRELGCYETPRAWANPHARWRFLQDRTADLSFEAYNDRTFHVHMLSGLPGTGKSTVAKKLGLPVVSRDELRDKAGLDPADRSDQGRVSQLFQETLKTYLRRKESCVIDGTNLLRNLRGNTIDMCANYGAEVTLHHFDRDRQTVFTQNKAREAVVPERVIERMAEGMEFPESMESHHLNHG